MKTRNRLLLLFAAVTGAAAVFWSTQRSAGGTSSSDAALTLTLARRDLVIEVVDTGRVQPKERIEIKSKVAGQVIELDVEEGARVKKGQLLLRLDPTDYRRDVARAEADVAQARNALEYAALNLERKKRALSDRGVAQIDVDLAANEHKSKTVALRSAEVMLATAQDRLRYTSISAPIDGTVLERGIQFGEVVTPGIQQTFEGRPLMTVGDLSALIVRSELNQIDIAKIAVGQKVRLSFDSLPGRTFEASVTKTAPASIKPKGKEIDVFPVEATLVEADPLIKPGMTADVRYLIEVRPGVLAAPIEAVVKDEGRSRVTKMVMVNGKKKREQVEVEIGARSDREVELISGVKEGDELVINPASSAENEVKL
jgi:membrane fusion protein, macrolide-specific efflux system